jgi:hypothetical protein
MTKNPPVKRGSPGKGRNRWTYEQRVALDVLWQHPDDLTPSKRAQCFNAIFKDHQAACGAHGGLAYSVLSCQYLGSTYKHKSTWAKNWGDVCAVPKLDAGLREQLRRKIDRVLVGGDAAQVSAGAATPPATPPERTEVTTSSSSGSHAGKRRAAILQRYREGQLITPGPSTRKRPASTPALTLVLDEDEDEEDFEPGPKRKRNARSPVVELPATPPQSIASVRLNTSGTTGGKSPKKSRVPGRGRPGANYECIRFDGTKLWLFYYEWLETQEPLIRPSEEAAHPKAGPALVFRYWSDKSHGW